MRERLIELLDGFLDLGYSSSYIADHILADGWIRPPCKVGDTVYEIHNENPFEEELQVMESKVECFFIGTSLDTHRIDGKTVFLTKESAENALKERERE